MIREIEDIIKGKNKVQEENYMIRAPIIMLIMMLN